MNQEDYSLKTVISSHVDPNTIVRCSGRVDMNGIKIFNRDIIKSYNFETQTYNIGVVTYCLWTNCWNVHFSRKGEDSANIDAVLLSQCYVVEVIGNTYDSLIHMLIT